MVATCNKSTDFHFPSFQEQLEAIKAQIAKRCVKLFTWCPKIHSGPLDNGDFVVTKHSNLQSLQIIFHLVQKNSGKQNDFCETHFTDPDSIEALLVGLKNILTFASKHDVVCITLPALLASDVKQQLTDAQLHTWFLKHSEVIFRLIKSFLLHTIAQQTRISTIQLVLPPAKELAQKLKSNFANLKH